jgi:hypothetical protein
MKSSINSSTSDLSPCSRRTSTVTPTTDKYLFDPGDSEPGQPIPPHHPHHREVALGGVVEHPVQTGPR